MGVLILTGLGKIHRKGVISDGPCRICQKKSGGVGVLQVGKNQTPSEYVKIQGLYQGMVGKDHCDNTVFH